MLELKRYPLVTHLRADASVHVLHFAKGRKVREGRGLAFWFRPINASLAALPMDDRELTFTFQGRSADFQAVHVQGAVIYRIADPLVAAQRIDFTVDLNNGAFLVDPMAQIASRMTELAQQYAWDFLVASGLQEILTAGLSALRTRLQGGLGAEESLKALGLEVISVRVTALRSDAEMEKALQTPTREAIQQQADQAVFQRRALAVEKERAIQENELKTKIELAKQQEVLLTQEGQNERRRRQEAAEAEKIAVESLVHRQAAEARARAESTTVVETARNAVEKERQEIFRAMPAEVILAQAAQTLAGKLTKIDNVSITPDNLAQILARIGLGGGKPDAAKPAKG